MLRPYSRRDTRGFSLLELLFVLALVAVVAALAIPAYYSRPAITLDNAARLLARDLRAAQNRAASLHVPVEMRFLPDGDGYEVLDHNGHYLADPGGGGDFIRSYSRDAVFEGVLITRLPGESTGPLHFDEQGFALDGARLLLSYREERRMVEIERGSGLLDVIGLSESWDDDGQ